MLLWRSCVSVNSVRFGIVASSVIFSFHFGCENLTGWSINRGELCLQWFQSCLISLIFAPFKSLGMHAVWQQDLRFSPTQWRVSRRQINVYNIIDRKRAIKRH
jgi:hypothetical protein